MDLYSHQFIDKEKTREKLYTFKICSYIYQVQISIHANLRINNLFLLFIFFYLELLLLDRSEIMEEQQSLVTLSFSVLLLLFVK